MPEGPEVKIITEQLHSALVGQIIVECGASGRYLREPVEGWSEVHPRTRQAITKNLIKFPKTIRSIQCKGKFIYWDLGEEWYLWNTLGMTGAWKFATSDTIDKHVTFIVLLQNGTEIHFSDIRHFGTLKFVKGLDKIQAKLQTLGPDLLAGEITLDYVNNLCQKYKFKTIVEILMNQKLIPGVGNYIKSEALYRAKISPWRQGGQMAKSDLQELLNQLLQVSQSSYEFRGNTFKDYHDLNGELGTFSQFLQVYKKKICPLGYTIKNEDTLDKRTSWWVPQVQL